MAAKPPPKLAGIGLETLLHNLTVHFPKFHQKSRDQSLIYSTLKGFRLSNAMKVTAN